MMRRINAAPDRPWKATTPEQVRVYVWEWPIRFVHWTLAVTILVLSVTGFYMHAPYVTVQGNAAYVMGWMRFVHIIAAYAFTLALLVRVAWFFLGNKWVRLNQYIPLTKSRFKGLLACARYYSFTAWSPKSYIGHNPLAGLSYLAVYVMVFVQVLTGFSMFAIIVDSPTLKFLFGWLPLLINIQYLREIHFLVMFCLWMFFIYHLYTAILVAVEERSALLDSIFSGFKYVPEDELAQELAETESPEEVARALAGVEAETQKTTAGQ